LPAWNKQSSGKRRVSGEFSQHGIVKWLRRGRCTIARSSVPSAEGLLHLKKLKLTNFLARDAKTLPMMFIKPKELKTFCLPLNPSARPDEYVEADYGSRGRAYVLENFEVWFEEFRKFGSRETKNGEALTETIMKLQRG
jgi:hypothetical protein